MRLLEIVFIAADFLLVAALLAGKAAWTIWMAALAIVALALALVHVCVEGARWQMYPAYMVAAVLATFAIANWSQPKRFGRLFSSGAMAGLLSSVALGTVLPIFSLPTPDGPFAIGTVTHIWFRPVASRDIAPNWAASRKIIVQIWYPAAPAESGKLAPYRDSDSGWLLTHYLALVRTHARIGAVISQAQSTYPVVLFSPLWGGGRSDYTSFYEMLASHGFVVAAMEHVKDLNGQFMGLNLEEYREAGALVRRRAEDAAYVLDELTKRNESDSEQLLTGRLDLSRVGILGHSFGGAAAAEACRLDPRFKAGIDMDGDLYGEVADAGASQPFFFISSDFHPHTDAELHAADPVVRLGNQMENMDWDRKVSWLVHRGGYHLMIHKTSHLNYSDRPLFSPVKRLAGAGEVDPRRALQITDAYILAFFDRTLKQQAGNLLDGPTDRFPEAIFKTYPVPVDPETPSSKSE